MKGSPDWGREVGTVQTLIGWDPVRSAGFIPRRYPGWGQDSCSAPGAGPVVRAGIVRVVQAALGGSEHALRLHHKHVVEVPHQHGQQGQERQAVAKASEGAAHGEGQPVYQPARARKGQATPRVAHWQWAQVGRTESWGGRWVLVDTTDTFTWFKIQRY